MAAQNRSPRSRSRLGGTRSRRVHRYSVNNVSAKVEETSANGGKSAAASLARADSKTDAYPALPCADASDSSGRMVETQR